MLIDITDIDGDLLVEAMQLDCPVPRVGEVLLFYPPFANRTQYFHTMVRAVRHVVENGAADTVVSLEEFAMHCEDAELTLRRQLLKSEGWT